MSCVIPIESYNSDPIEIVPVIATYDTEGNLKPIYVRLNGDSLKVDTYLAKASEESDIDFYCTLSHNDCRMRLILTYHVKETVWSITNRLRKTS